MTDDEIDAAIRAAVPDACFTPNAAARAIYLAGYRAGIEAAAKKLFGIMAAIRALADR